MPRRFTFLVLLFCFLLSAGTAAADPWIKVLIPIYFEEEVPGAFGSRWVMELYGYNAAGVHQRFTAHWNRDCDTPSQCGDFIAPGEFFNAQAYLDTSLPGQPIFAYINTAVTGVDVSKHLMLSLRTRDVSREAEGFGTSIPIVREEDTFTNGWSIGFPNIPAGPNYRQKLRIYDFDYEGGRSVTIEVVDGLQKVATRTLTFPYRVLNGRPGYLHLDLDTLPELAGRERLNVIVRTPKQGHFWAFVSVTNNATQQVTTLFP